MAADAQLVIWAYESFSGVGMDVGDWLALFRCALLIVVVIQYVPSREPRTRTTCLRRRRHCGYWSVPTSCILF